MKQHQLAPPKGAKHARKRLGRGSGTGQGTYAGKGRSGQKSRSGFGGDLRPGFEGGQLPLIKRLPSQRGFRNPFRVEYAEVNVGLLEQFPEKSEVNPATLKQAGLVKSADKPVKILGNGDLKVALTVKAQKFSKSAKEKIEAAGGKAEEIGATVPAV